MHLADVFFLYPEQIKGYSNQGTYFLGMCFPYMLSCLKKGIKAINEVHSTFIQSNLPECIQVIHFFISMHVPCELNPQPFALKTQCSTAEPQEHSVVHVRHVLKSSKAIQNISVIIH